MSDVYTVFAYDINTNTKLTELPGTGLTFGHKLNDAGACQFSLPLGRKGMAALVAPLLAYDGIPVKLYIDRDGVIQGTYIAWTGNYQKSTGLLPIGGKELISIFSQRIQVADYSVVTYPSGLDPAVLLYKAVTDAQADPAPGSSIGLQVVNGSTGMPVIIPGYPSSQRATVQSIMSSVTSLLAPGVGSVDMQFSSAWDPSTGNPVDTLRLVTPRAGRVAGSTGLIFDLDSVIDYNWPTDATQAGTTITATGAGNGDAMPVQTVQAPGVPVGALGQSPRLDKVVSTTSQSQGDVNLLAQAAASQFGRPVRTPTVLVPTASPSQPLGSWIMGDDARLYTPKDERFPSGKDEYWRIVQDDISVPDEGVPTVLLTFNLPPTY